MGDKKSFHHLTTKKKRKKGKIDEKMKRLWKENIKISGKGSPSCALNNSIILTHEVFGADLASASVTELAPGWELRGSSAFCFTLSEHNCKQPPPPRKWTAFPFLQGRQATLPQPPGCAVYPIRRGLAFYQKTRERCGCLKPVSGIGLGFPRKIPGKLGETCWKNCPESRKALNSGILGTGKGKPAANLGLTLP